MNPQGAIACGHELTAQAAAQILARGGNAFDAVVAAHFAACIAEPVLASLGGGGFLLAHPVNGDDILYDFFAQTPLNKRPAEDIDFFPIVADFGETTQEFHVGMASIATPGAVKGMFAIYQDLCSLPVEELLAPAIQLARDGVVVNEFQAYVFDIVKPIYLSSDECFNIFCSPASDKSQRRLVGPGEILKQPEMADTLENLAKDGENFFYGGDISNSIVKHCREHGGYLTNKDFSEYQVIKRKPLRLTYRDHVIYTNPSPSSGGLLIAFALELLQKLAIANLESGSLEYIDFLSYVMHLTNKARIDSSLQSGSLDNDKLLHDKYLEAYQQLALDRYSFSRGTTHISVIDKSGNVASLTVSNGEGCGFVAPGSGIMLNNMLGEEDLNPQVLVQLIDYKLPLAEAIEYPRIHFENGLLNIEAGLTAIEPSRFNEQIKDLKYWSSQNLFFGGVNAVMKTGDSMQGMGDPRRGGVSILV